MKNLLIILMSLMLLVGCSDELDIKSEASLSASAKLSESDVDKLLTGLYAEITNPSKYGYFQIMYPGLLADNLKEVKFQWFQVRHAFNHSIQDDDILNLFNYQNFYEAISKANTILGVPGLAKVQEASAKFCRAYSYFRLVDIYQDVPIVKVGYDNKPIVPSKYADVLNFMVEDLVFAKQFGVKYDKLNRLVSNTEPSSEAAQALLARVYRLQGDLSKAGVEAEDLITKGNFSLSTDPADRTTETILRFKSIEEKDNGYWGYIMNPISQTWNCLAMSDELIALLDDDDTRNDLYYTAKISGIDYVFQKKYKTNGDSDLLVSRIAEMYLISAEAGNTSRLTELQTIRKSSLSLDNERRLELAAEWVRWSDLRLKGETYRVPFPLMAQNANPLLNSK